METPGAPLDRDVLIALNRSATTARLMSGAVHEVNNALQVISGTVEMLEGQTLPPPVLTALERLRRQGARAAAALDEVLTFTRAPVRGVASVNLRETAAHSVALRRFALVRAGVAITLSADEATSFTVFGNRGQLQQAILNLIINAEQSAAPARGSIAVVLTADDTAITVQVTDTGSGVPAALRESGPQLFVSTRAPQEGAGLGLWAAKTIAEAHGGRLEIDEAATGASLRLVLPRTPGAI